MFVLGVGAQKAGTSWLYSQLARTKNFAPFEAKELHYWDNCYSQYSEQVQTEEDIQNWFTASNPSEIGSPREVTGEDYFSKIREASRRPRGFFGSEKIVADITPAYSGLPVFVWRNILDQLQKQQIEYRVVYLLRDPVLRITSALNMNARRNNLRGFVRGVSGVDQFSSIAREVAASWHFQSRTRYELTLQNLDSVFPPDKVFVGFQELISSAQQHQQLQDFLGFSIRHFDYQTRPQTDEGYMHLNRETASAVASSYVSTYIAMRDRYSFAEDIWSGYQFLEK
jgi:hypothetical protein